MDFNVGDKVFFNYSKYDPYREGIIKGMNKDGTYRVRYQDCGWKCRTKVAKSKIKYEKPQRVLKEEDDERQREKERWDLEIHFYSKLEALCDKYNLEYYFDVDHPWLNKIEASYYGILDNCPDIANFLEKNNKLSDSINFTDD